MITVDNTNLNKQMDLSISGCDMRKINKIILHHSASPMSTTTFEDIKRWHLERGFKDIGYHWVIDKNGELWKGRPESQIGAHCKGHNRDSIGICIVGNFELEELNEYQFNTLRYLLYFLEEKYYTLDIHNHYYLSKTKCPGKNMIEIL